MRPPAKHSDWETKPLPAEREDFDFHISYDADQSDLIRRGCVPVAMEDRWFIYLKDNWLYFHRTWTGYAVYAVEFERNGGSLRAVSAWVNRDQTQYEGMRIEEEKNTLIRLVELVLLNRV